MVVEMAGSSNETYGGNLSLDWRPGYLGWNLSRDGVGMAAIEGDIDNGNDFNGIN